MNHIHIPYIFLKLFKENNMQDPKQLYLFNYMDPQYDVSYDDMETDDYDAMWSLAEQDAEYEAYLDSLVTE